MIERGDDKGEGRVKSVSQTRMLKYRIPNNVSQKVNKAAIEGVSEGVGKFVFRCAIWDRLVLAGNTYNVGGSVRRASVEDSVCSDVQCTVR